MAIDKIIRPDGEIPIFGGESEADELKIFGTETESEDITLLLTNQNAKDGWASGVDSNGFPALSWFNAVGHTLSYITSLYLQDGITDWNTNQSYYTNSLVKSPINGFTYISKTGTAPSTPNPGTNDPSTDSTNWRLAFLDSANTVVYVPTSNYHPSTKKYVDDAVAASSGGKILQEKTVNKTDTFTTASGTFTDITDLSITITPSSASNKIKVSFQLQIGNTNNGDYTFVRLIRDATPIAIGDAVGSRIQSTAAWRITDVAGVMTVAIDFEDDPATTSPTTYKVQMTKSGGTALLNRSGTDTDNATFTRLASTFTVKEIGA